MSAVRVRFAPSPTGFLHVGGLRTALYNFLFARRNNGVFILRIEDTDRSRYVEGAVENLIQTLHWAGLEYDEGPLKGGPNGPYVQSERTALYREYAGKLLESGKAYYAFDTPEELEEMRRQQENMRTPPKYDRRALRLSPDEVKKKLSTGVPAVVRMKVPEGSIVAVDDLVRGRVEFSSDRLDDQVLVKSDGYPTYHLANVVDDHLMKISHVVRGEEWLSSTPKHVLLYHYLGWEPPQFAHLPLLLNPDRSKLSKRQGDVAVEEYRKKGYLPEALVNFVALLGWNPGDERELFTLEELIREFSLERVGKSGAVFNIEKLDWLNFQHLRRAPDQRIIELLRSALETSGIPGKFEDEYLLQVIGAMRERAMFVKDIVDRGGYFFAAPRHYDPDVVRKRWKADTAAQLSRLAEAFSRVAIPSKEEFESALRQAAGEAGTKPADLIHPLRLAVSGVGEGPGVFDIVAIIGREETIRRITSAIEELR